MRLARRRKESHIERSESSVVLPTREAFQNFIEAPLARNFIASVRRFQSLYRMVHLRRLQDLPHAIGSCHDVSHQSRPRRWRTSGVKELRS